MELNRTCAEHDACSPHPAYTYGELYNIYLSCIAHVNGPTVGRGAQTMSKERIRVRSDSFNAFRTMISKSRVQEIAEQIDCWENVRQREQQMLVKLAELRQELRWGISGAFFED